MDAMDRSRRSADEADSEVASGQLRGEQVPLIIAAILAVCVACCVVRNRASLSFALRALRLSLALATR